MTQYRADDELQTLVNEFKSEFEEQIQGFGNEGFIGGLEVPAIPLVVNKEIGLAQIKKYLDLVIDSKI